MFPTELQLLDETSKALPNAPAHYMSVHHMNQEIYV